MILALYLILISVLLIGCVIALQCYWYIIDEIGIYNMNKRLENKEKK